MTTVRCADGTGLAVHESGHGAPVVFIAGLGYAAWSWAGQRALAPGFRVISVDNRGAGESDKPPGPYSIELLADDMAGILGAIDAAPAHVVGASMGGYIAMMLAQRRPELVRSLTLIATSAGGAGSVPVPETTAQAWARWAPAGPERFARATMPLSFRPGWTDEHPDDTERLIRARLAHPTPPDAWRAQFDACERFLRDGLPRGRLDQPALVLHGTADRVVPYANASLVVQRLAAGRLVRLDGAGHLCWIEQPDRVNALIRDHIDAVRRGCG